jgi:hypothetical protein
VPQPGIDTLTFAEAMREVADGGRVTKLEWGDRKMEVYLSGTLKILLAAKGYDAYDLIVSEGDMKGCDWVVISSAEED